MAGVTPEPDCSYKDDLKTIWKEDFGFIPSGEQKSSTSVYNLKYFVPTDGKCFNEFENNDYGKYAILSAPNKMVKKYIVNEWNGSAQVDVEKTESCGEREMTDNSGLPSGAMLYTRYKNKKNTEASNLLYEKTVSGIFCPCKSFIFSFAFNNIRDYYGGIDFIIKIVDDSGNLLGYNEYSSPNIHK